MPILALFGVALCHAAQAEQFNVAVSRAESNLYKVDGKPTFVTTRDCNQVVTSADAVLQMAGLTGKIHFVAQGTACEVTALYRKSRLRPGNYVVTVAREDDSWYRLDGLNDARFFRSGDCSKPRLSEQAFLRIENGDSGRLHYVGTSDDCLVTELFQKVQL